MEGDVKVPHTCVLLNGHRGSNSYGCKVKLDFIHILLLFNIFICVLLFLSQPQSENSCTFCSSVRDHHPTCVLTSVNITKKKVVAAHTALTCAFTLTQLEYITLSILSQLTVFEIQISLIPSSPCTWL